jgi:hypothetical protein
MTTGSGIDLHHARARRADAVAIARGFLIAFNHANVQLRAAFTNGSFEQGRFACAGRTHQIDGANISAVEPAAVLFGEPVILQQDIVFETDDCAVAVTVVVIVRMAVAMFMGMFVLMRMRMAVVMVVSMFVAIAMRMVVGVSVLVAGGVNMNMAAGLKVRHRDFVSFRASTSCAHINSSPLL